VGDLFRPAPADADTPRPARELAVSMTAGLHTHSHRLEEKMSTPTGGNAFPHGLELTVRAELTIAEGVITAGHLPDEPGPGISLLPAREKD
jgi:hypothetical protein